MTPATQSTAPLCPTCGVLTVSAGFGLRACASEGCRRVLPPEAFAAAAQSVELVVELPAPPAPAEVSVCAPAPIAEVVLCRTDWVLEAPIEFRYTAPPPVPRATPADVLAALAGWRASVETRGAFRGPWTLWTSGPIAEPRSVVIPPMPRAFTPGDLAAALAEIPNRRGEALQ